MSPKTRCAPIWARDAQVGPAIVYYGHPNRPHVPLLEAFLLFSKCSLGGSAILLEFLQCKRQRQALQLSLNLLIAIVVDVEQPI